MHVYQNGFHNNEKAEGLFTSWDSGANIKF